MKSSSVRWYFGFIWVVLTLSACGGSADPIPPPVFNEYNPASADTDGDGVVDAQDAFPADAAETLDFDGDGVGDNADPDDDNDGVPDGVDAFPKNASEFVDTDGDGVGDTIDPDDDGDGVPDAQDAFPLDADRTLPDLDTLPGGLDGTVIGFLDEPLFGEVSVSIDSGQSLTLDNGATEFNFEQVPPGPAIVTVSAPGYVTIVETIDIPGGGRGRFYFELVPGIRIADTPTAEAVSMVNGGADFLIFDNGSPTSSDEPLEGDFWLIDREGGNRRDLVSGVAPDADSEFAFTPDRDYLYVAERDGPEMNIRVFDLASAAELPNIASGCSLPEQFHEAGLALTASSSLLGADMRCVVPITGGTKYHEIPDDANLRGFGTDGAYYYAMPPSAGSGNDLMRVDPASLIATKLGRVANKVYSSSVLQAVADGAVVVALCDDADCESPATSLISSSGVVTKLDSDPLGVLKVQAISDVWLVKNTISGAYRAVPLSGSGAVALTMIPANAPLAGSPSGLRVVYDNGEGDLVSTSASGDTKTLVASSKTTSINMGRLCVSGGTFAFADSVGSPVVYMGNTDGTGTISEIDLSKDDSFVGFVNVSCVGDIVLLDITNSWDAREVRPYNAVSGSSLFDFKTLNIRSQLAESLGDGRFLVRVNAGTDASDYYLCDFTGTPSCDRTAQDVAEYRYTPYAENIMFLIPGIPERGSALSSVVVAYDIATGSTISIPASIGRPFLASLPGADYYFGLSFRSERLLTWQAGAAVPEVAGYFGCCRLNRRPEGPLDYSMLQGSPYFVETMETDILVSTIVSWRATSYGSYLNWYPEAVIDD